MALRDSGTGGRRRTTRASRLAQLRQAKRTQRAKDRAAGLVVVSLKVPAAEARRLRAAKARPAFASELSAFLDDTLIEVSRFGQLSGLCWNRRSAYLDPREAFQLYERNWRFVDTRRLTRAERALIERLAARFGRGVLNV